MCTASRRRRPAVANALPAGVERRRRLWVRLARSFTSLGSRVIACAVPQRRQTKEANRRGSTGNSVTGLLGRRQESSTHRFCDSAPRLVCEPAQRRAAPCALLASPRHALLVAGALRDASQRFLHRSAVPRRRGRTWTCAPRDPPGHFERARPPFKNPPRTAARRDTQRSRAEFLSPTVARAAAPTRRDDGTLGNR